MSEEKKRPSDFCQMRKIIDDQTAEMYDSEYLGQNSWNLWIECLKQVIKNMEEEIEE